MSDTSVSEAVGSLYEDPITVGDLQAALLSAAARTEIGGPTPPKDQKIIGLIYNYMQANKENLTPEVLGNFSPLGGWICCGREVAKFLAYLPNHSLAELVASANAHGYSAEVVE